MGIKSLFKKSKKNIQKIIKKRNVIDFYDFVNYKPMGIGMRITPANTPANSITWVIPNFGQGSGGHLNLFRFIYMLEKRGFTNQIINIAGNHQWTSETECHHAIREWFFPINAQVTFGDEGLTPCRFLIATSWITAYTVRNYQDCQHKLYFVQDFEPYFYAHGSEYYFAEDTYNFGFTGITAGDWLKNKLQSEYGMECYSLGFSYQKDLYKRTEKLPNKNRNIFFYARPVTPRRSFEIGLLALNQLAKEVNNMAVIFAGWDVSGYQIDFHHLNAGTLPVAELPDLYTQCDVALILSATNLSLLPIEAMACGCPIVINDGAHNRWLFGDNEAHFCKNSINSITNGLKKVLTDSQYATQLSQNGLQFSASTSWDKEGDKLAEILRDF